MAEASKSVGADSIRPKKIAILVAGMHRSGTSTTTRILNLLGCDLPRTPLVVPNSYKKFNEKGHWESEHVKDLNDEILSSAGSSWDDWRVFDAGWYASPVAEQFRERAQRLLHEEFGDSRLFVLKDPRICRLLKFWIEEVRNFGAEPCVVSPIRNPLDVGSSLERRDGIDTSIGHLLWLRHVLNAERASRDINRAYVSYDTLLTDTHAVVDMLARTLEISWPKRGAISSQMKVDEFVSPALRHHRSDDIGFLTNPRISRWVTTSFEIFDRWSRTDIRTTDTGELDEIRAAFDESAFAFSRALAVGSNAAKGLKAAQATLKERDGQLEALNQTIAEHRKQISDLHQTVADRDKWIKAAQATLKERDEQLAVLNRAVTDRDRWLADLHTSNSWRMTAPFRKARRVSFTVLRKSRSFVSRTVRTFYRRVPLPFKVKLHLKDQLFRLLPFLFRHTWVYRTWKTVDRDTPTSMPARSSSSPTERQSDHAVSQYVARTLDAIDPETLAVKLVAFYLPQFHPIRENDEWWGKGFTEWTNVVKAQPNFEGHYQPRLPADLGFYDLRVAEVMEQQAELARQYGIYGFCYHYYWFGGKRLLEMPLERMLRTGKPNIPFCLSWANENWSRRWDGLEHEILIAQRHSDEDDTAVIRDLIRYFRHPNYIRIKGKPLLLIYRIGLFPNIRHTVERWRALCQKEGVGEIYLAMVESFEHASTNDDPKIYGFDASVEYPPHWMPTPIEVPGPILNSDYVGLVNDYREIVRRYLQKDTPSHTKFRGIMPDWDNTARKQNHAHIFHYSSPDAYQGWLQVIIEQTRERYMGDERMVFVNAWNEWAEGAYLEPDRKYGFAYLEATKSALKQAGVEAAHQLLFVIHDMHPHGAQYISLATVDGLASKLGIHVHIASLEGGPLLDRFEKHANIHRLWETKDPMTEAADLARRLYKKGVTCAILNTTVTGKLTPVLKKEGLRTVNLIHEMPRLIESKGLKSAVAAIAEHSDLVVFPAPEVRQGFETFAPLQGKVCIRPQGLYKVNRHKTTADRRAARRNLCAALNITDDSRVVIGVGYGDERKGIDLFMDVACQVIDKLEKTHFVWVGDISEVERPVIERRREASRHGPHVHLVGNQHDTDVFYAGADVLALTSREDPFPSVVMEAMDVGVPVIGFDGAGGFAGLLHEGVGRLVPFEDTKAFADEVCTLLGEQTAVRRLGTRGKEIISERFGWTRFIVDLGRMAMLPIHRVSVIVPNYNYRRYLQERLDSIAAQTYPIYELIVLDDASDDGSREWLKDEAARHFPEVRLVFNQQNSGSVSSQWLKGAQLASGDILWIAEADDVCEPDFVRTVIRSFDAPETILSYCQSKQMLADGSIASNDYLAYVADLSTERWYTDHVSEGIDEITSYLAVKNTIPNVSGVLMRREPFVDTMTNWFEQISQLRIAGDWLTYVLYLEQSGRVAFHAEALNSHRRHSAGVVISNRGTTELREILAVQRFISNRYQVAASTQKMARKYSQELYSQFGLEKNVHGTIDDIALSGPTLEE